MTPKINWSGRSYSYIDEEIAAVIDVMENADSLTQGPYRSQFETDFENLIGHGRQCFATTNCASALELSAILSDLDEKDEVIIPTHTYCASAIPFCRTGAKIIWGDIDPNTFIISLTSIKKLTTLRTKVVVLVHLYGMMSPETPKIQEFCRENDILLVEDCAQSLGAHLGEKPAGSFGDFSTFSFHSQKNITTIGEGGMLAISNPKIASKVTGMRHNGHTPFKNQTEYWLPAMTNVDEDMTNQWPYNFSMTEVQAALGSSSLKRLNKMINQRRQRALKFREAFSDYKELQFQKIDKPEAHSHHLLPAKFCPTQKGQNRNDLIRLLYDEHGVKAIVQYYPLHRYDLFKKKGFGFAECPESDLFFDNMISFPFNLIMTEGDFDYMIDSTKKSLETLRCKT